MVARRVAERECLYRPVSVHVYKCLTKCEVQKEQNKGYRKWQVDECNNR